jgi:cyclophilin family peptidyl-prolyl cis-trans isomerase/HEAT repeat protein
MFQGASNRTTAEPRGRRAWETGALLLLLVLIPGCPLRDAPPARRDARDAAAPDGSSLSGRGIDAAPGRGDASGPDAVDGSTAADGPLLTLARLEDSRRMARPVFERLVRDPDVVVRRRALLALARVRRAEGLAPLRGRLTDEDPEVRQIALFAIGTIEAAAHRDAEEVIQAFLGTAPSPADRRAAVLALGKVGSSASEAVVLEALESPEPRLRSAAARALGFLAMRLDPPAEGPIPSLVPRLEDTSADVRLAAAFALSRGARPSDATATAVTATLEKLLRADPNPEVRIMAGRALAHLGLTSSKSAVAALERDPDWRVRTAAAFALGQGAPPGVVSRALGLVWARVASDPARLTSSEVHPLLALLQAIETRNEPGSQAALTAVHRDAVKLAAGNAADPQRLRALAHVRCAAALALDRLRGRPGLVLACAGGPEGTSLLEPWEIRALEARAWRSSIQKRALNAVAKLARDEDERVRVEAVQAAETLADERRLALFERALGDPSPAVVASAASALWTAVALFEVQERPDEQLTVTEHTPDGPVVHRISTEGVTAPPVPSAALAKALDGVDTDRDVETAVGLLKLVGRLDVADAVDRVRTLAGHHNPTVRGEARHALEAMDLDPGAEIAPDPPNLIDPVEMDRLSREPHPRVVFVTTAGSFTVELRPDLAPATAANLVRLVRDGFYRGVPFHRVVPGFVAQVGDPGGTGFGGPGYTVRCEVTDTPYRRGSVGMALAGPDTGGSQIFVTYSAQPHLDGRYTLFGQVVSGMDVVEAVQTWDSIVEAHVEGEVAAPMSENQRKL